MIKIIDLRYVFIFYTVLFLNCASKNKIISEGPIYIYKCEEINLIYIAEDSTKIFVYPGFFKTGEKYNKVDDISLIYQDSTIVKLFLSGNITKQVLWGLQPDSDGWSEFETTQKKVNKINSDDCYSVVTDSNMTIIELMQTTVEKDEAGNIVYSFQITYKYGTVHHCFDVKKLDNRKYAIRNMGSIL
jgi:hypothetical protein